MSERHHLVTVCFPKETVTLSLPPCAGSGVSLLSLHEILSVYTSSYILMEMKCAIAVLHMSRHLAFGNAGTQSTREPDLKKLMSSGLRDVDITIGYWKTVSVDVSRMMLSTVTIYICTAHICLRRSQLGFLASSSSSGTTPAAPGRDHRASAIRYGRNPLFEKKKQSILLDYFQSKIN